MLRIPLNVIGSLGLYLWYIDTQHDSRTETRLQQVLSLSNVKSTLMKF